VSVEPAVSRLGSPERGYLNEIFAELCEIESPSRSERRCADRVAGELRALGLSVEEDGAAAVTGCNSGNLIARMPGTPGASRSLLLCAHLDTVPLAAPVDPVLVGDGWENANDAILGADNKAAVAVLLALVRHLRREPAPIDLELVFTVGEELALAGARALEVARLQSAFGYVFDHPSPIGEVIVDSPTHFRIHATFRGAAAHAGIAPEEGRSAILAAARAVSSLRLGRVDELTTANVGTIEGGSAINVVPQECTLLAEVRSIEDARAEALVAEIVDRLHEAGNDPDCDCDLDVDVERTFTGYRQPPRSVAVEVAERALRACGYEPQRVASGGGSDANALIAAGMPTVNLANGTERNHEPDERVSVLALEGMLDVALALVEESAAVPADAGR
jgi:tripeptide aminopeptidase